MRYAITVSGGPVPDSVLDQFAGLQVSPEPPELTVHGELPDQAALHGLLKALQSSGLVLIDVRRTSVAEHEGDPPG